MSNLENRSDYRKEVCARVCEKIKELREHSGMTQAELAKKANIAQSTLSYVEAGSKSPTIDTMAALSEALGVPLRMLMPEEVAQARRDSLTTAAQGAKEAGQ